MQVLNLPAFNIKTRSITDKTEVFDQVRKDYVLLTPEEWVRQHFINYLITDRLVPPGLIAVEKQIRVNRLSKRCDIVIYLHDGKPALVVECKAPHIKINRETYDQAVRYNLTLNIRYMVLTNGMNHFCFKLNYQTQESTLLNHIPAFQEMTEG
jgi:hypothetical protein